MKAKIEVKDRDEARWIRCALDNPAMREYVVFAGKMLDIDTDYAPRIIAEASGTLRNRLEQLQAVPASGTFDADASDGGARRGTHEVAPSEAASVSAQVRWW